MGDRARPFFEAVPADDRPRILLISYHFPPGQAVGALRWEQLARFAAERGWALDVIMASPADDAGDAARLRALPAGTRLYGVALPDAWTARVEPALWSLAHRLWRAGRRARNAAAGGDGAAPAAVRVAGSLPREEMRLSIREPRTLARGYHAFARKAEWHGWARRAARVARSIIEPGVHRVIVSCGPPHEAHEAARRAARSTGLPLVLDLRDPWSLIERLPEPIASPVWLRAAAREERRGIAAARLVVCNTEPSRRALAALYPEASDRIITVMNGYDEEEMPHARRDERFTIAYAGSIYIDRDPRLVFRAAARVITELGLTPAQFGFELIGNVERYEGMPVSAIAHEEGIADFVRTGPSRPRAEARAFLAGATMLLSLPQDSDMAIPAKVFEYMPFDAWLLILAERGSATEMLLRGTEADVVSPRDVDAMAAVLRTRYLQHARGERPRPVARDERFSRRAQARILFDALEDIAGAPLPARGAAGAAAQPRARSYSAS